MYKAIIALLVISVGKVHGTYTGDDNQQGFQVYTVGQGGPPNTLTYDVNQISIEDAKLNFTELATKYGYGSETHKVQTEDGYILTMFRLWNEKKCPERKPIPVCMTHGLLDSSDTWILSGTESGLAYNLADKCFDIWLPNDRGNRYSQEHISMKPTQIDFWQFTFDEIGYFDVPASLDYIMKYTKQDKVNYIGHSQGTASFFIMTSSRPEYNERINVAICLAPIAWLYHFASPIVNLLVKISKGLFSDLTKIIGVTSIFTRGSLLAEVLEAACQLSPFAVCDNIIDVIAGQNKTDLTQHTIQTIFGHYPCGTSIQNLFHYVQGIEKNLFRHFDYGEKNNWAVYGSADPPNYDVSKISTNVALFSGLHDKLSSLADVKTLKKHMSDGVVIDHYIIPEDSWGHGDFVWGTSVPKVIMPRILDLFAKYGGYDDCDD